MKQVGFILVHKTVTPHEVVQSQGSAKLYLTEAAARGARTNMFGFRAQYEYSTPLKERDALRRKYALEQADIVPVFADVK